MCESQLNLLFDYYKGILMNIQPCQLQTQKHFQQMDFSLDRLTANQCTIANQNIGFHTEQNNCSNPLQQFRPYQQQKNHIDFTQLPKFKKKKQALSRRSKKSRRTIRKYKNIIEQKIQLQKSQQNKQQYETNSQFQEYIDDSLQDSANNQQNASQIIQIMKDQSYLMQNIIPRQRESQINNRQLSICLEMKNKIDLIRDSPTQDYISKFNKFERQIQSSVSDQNIKNLKIIRNNSFCNYFAPQFVLYSPQNDSQLLYAKKVSLFTFIFSNKVEQFEQNSDHCVGKLVSNFNGSLLNFFSKVSFNEMSQMQLSCRIEYRKNVLDFWKPRNMNVYLQTSHRQADRFTIKSSSIAAMKQAIETQVRRQSLIALQSRNPEYDSKRKQYKLQFRGRSRYSSIKNFILEQPQRQGRNVLLLGKIGKNEYNLDVAHPLNALTAFAIALSNFNGKIICQ